MTISITATAAPTANFASAAKRGYTKYATVIDYYTTLTVSEKAALRRRSRKAASKAYAADQAQA